MKYVDAGSGKIPFISLLAILSISLTVNLPGLAISPIMGKLDQVFHHVSELQIQLLSVLPNLITIPFILCSGKICTPKNQLYILGIGLGIFTLTGVLYFFADSMIELILLSCLLGVGCGLVIPLAASLISQHFTGNARARQLGMKSSLSNFSVIFATLFVGWMAEIDWHLSFIVYMIPIIPLCLIPFMTGSYIKKYFIPKEVVIADDRKEGIPIPKRVEPKATHGKYHFEGKTAIYLLIGVMAVYLIATYGTMVVSYYIPFTMEHYRLDSGAVGVATAMYFAGATISGFFLIHIKKLFGKNTIIISLAMCVAGIFAMGILHHYWSYVLSILIMGLGYGVIQPVIYNKTAHLAPSPERSTAYFSYLLTCNYVGIALVPLVIKGAEGIMRESSDPNYSYIFNGIVLAIMLVIAIWKRNSFVFKEEAYEETEL